MAKAQDRMVPRSWLEDAQRHEREAEEKFKVLKEAIEEHRRAPRTRQLEEGITQSIGPENDAKLYLLLDSIDS